MRIALQALPACSLLHVGVIMLAWGPTAVLLCTGMAGTCHAAVFDVYGMLLSAN